MSSEPVATYRLQLTADFGFEDAAALAGYLARLGVSHMYTSPSLQAAAGSLSGYDVVDPARVSEDLGGEAGHAKLGQALREAGLQRMIDIVPNHMAISDDRNPWWRDVLENGPASRYAPYFDIDWEASEETARNEVLLPILGDHFGRVLAEGKLRLAFQDGVFEIQYEARAFPVEPRSLAGLLDRAAARLGDARLGFIADSYARLPRPTLELSEASARRHRDKAILAEMVARLCVERPPVERALQDEVERLNASLEELAQFIEAQNYRLAHWRVAEADLGYRRFFNINDLVGLRAELPEVFRDTHEVSIKWIDEGDAHALRVDHPDGLRDPLGYFLRLREACPDAWIVAEKILEGDEELRDNWPIDGTTGYEFLNRAGGLLVDPAAEAGMTAFYEEFSGASGDWEAVAAQSKRDALDALLRSEVNRLASLLQRICDRARRHRDHTRPVLTRALAALAIEFPVYRSYGRVGVDDVDELDAAIVGRAAEAARAAHPDEDAELFEFLESLLLLQVPGELETEFALRFQQLTGPATAKGLEDTAFYRYYRFAALNEVGGDPGAFGVRAAAFHAACERVAARWPRTLLASSTHDTKRSEDVRARLCVLSEIPDAWADACREWRRMNAGREGADLLDGNTEYLFYQTLVGAWPVGEERVLAVLQKSIREAKQRTTWTRQDAPYETAVESFARAALHDSEFMASVESLVATIREAGWRNGLSQTFLKLTAPGVPDIYQGCELWDYSLVDPDNRRPVDFARRQALLEEAESLDASAAMARLEEGLPKLWLIRRVLQIRREQALAFSKRGGYQALASSGAKADHIVAFCRSGRVAAVAGRWFLKLGDDWGDTTVALPQGRWRDALEPGEAFTGSARAADLLRSLPVALVVRED